ncbi:30S ribosomal protein S6e [Candidatus Woesearchaeota archaeon]|nr:30S ribosomal protein S6e [Candidatus Woesearchaeota archaeon]
MAQFKICIGDPKAKKSIQKEVSGDAAAPFLGLKIGDKFNGELLDVTGYEFEITGGSDIAGFPMRKDAQGTGLRKILAIKGIGISNKKKYRSKKKKGLRTMKGMRQRKTIAANTIFDRTAQINAKVVKYGVTPLIEEKKEESVKKE